MFDSTSAANKKTLQIANFEISTANRIDRRMKQVRDQNFCFLKEFIYLSLAIL
jgi:hypothetical protein